MKIKNKISMLAIISIVSLSILIMGTLYYSLNKSSEERVKDYHMELINERTLMLRSVTESAASLIQQVYAEYLSDLEKRKITLRDEIKYKDRALQMVDAIRFGDNGYFYTYTYDGINIQHAVNKKLVGKNLINMQDKNGVMLIQELIARAKSGGGTVNFLFFNPVENKDSPKLGYAMGFDKWQWMFGTGVYIVDIDAKILQYRSQVSKDIRKTFVYIASIAFLFTVVILAVVYYISGRLGGRFKSIENTFVNISGNLDLAACVDIHGSDELSSVACNFNQLIDNIRSTMIEISDMSIDLAASSHQLSMESERLVVNAASQSASTEEITASVEEMTAGMDNIFEGTEHQFERLEILGSRIKELSDYILEAVLKADKAYELTRTITERAEHGERMLATMKQSMETIDKSSSDVTNIIGMINDISDRINLLSLNAAIEAARAGDAGKGFAVVAEQISHLADQTASSIKEIDKIISMNEKEIAEGRRTVDGTVSLIKSIIDGVSSINTMMNEISAAMKKQKDYNSLVSEDTVEIQTRAEEIRQSSHEQKSATEEIAKATMNINEFAQSNHLGAEGVMAAAEQTAAIAETLKQKIMKFKLRYNQS
jgi:methyl-accepting chemotaxis protein